MKTIIYIHENEHWIYYPNNGKIDHVNTGGVTKVCFFFDPINGTVTSVIPQVWTKEDPRAGNLYISLKFDERDLNWFLENPDRIKGLKEWLNNITKAKAKEYALDPSSELPKTEIKEKATEFDNNNQLDEAEKKIALQMMTAIIQTIINIKKDNSPIFVVAKKQRDDLIIDVLNHLPKALRKVTVSMPWSAGMDLARITITDEDNLPNISSPRYVVSDATDALKTQYPTQFAVAKMFFEDERWTEDKSFEQEDVSVVCELYNECKKRNLSDENIEKILYNELYKLYKQKAADGNQLRSSDIVNLYILQKIDGNVSNDRFFHLFYKDVISKSIIDIAPDDVLKVYRLLRQEIEDIFNEGKNIQNYSIPNFCKFYAAAIKKDECLKEIILTSDFYEFYKKIGELYVLEFYKFYKDICVKAKELSDIEVFCKFSRFCTIVVGANQTNNNADNSRNNISLHDVLDLDFYRFCTDAVNGDENPNEQSKIVDFYRFCRNYIAKNNNLKLSDILNLYLYRFYTDTNEISSPDNIVSFYESCKNVAKPNTNIKLSDILNLKYYKFYKGYIVTTKQQHPDIVKLYEFYSNIVAKANEHIALSDIFKFYEFYIKLNNIDPLNILEIYRFYANIVLISKNYALSHIVRIFFKPEQIVLTNEFCDFYIRLSNYNNIRKGPFNILNFYKFYSKGKIPDIAKSYSAYERGRGKGNSTLFKFPRWVSYLCAILVFIGFGNLFYYNLDKVLKLINRETAQESIEPPSEESRGDESVHSIEHYHMIQDSIDKFMQDNNITGSVFAYRPSNGDVYCIVNMPEIDKMISENKKEMCLIHNEDKKEKQSTLVFYSEKFDVAAHIIENCNEKADECKQRLDSTSDMITQLVADCLGTEFEQEKNIVTKFYVDKNPNSDKQTKKNAKATKSTNIPTQKKNQTNKKRNTNNKETKQKSKAGGNAVDSKADQKEKGTEEPTPKSSNDVTPDNNPENNAAGGQQESSKKDEPTGNNGSPSITPVQPVNVDTKKTGKKETESETDPTQHPKPQTDPDKTQSASDAGTATQQQ